MPHGQPPQVRVDVLGSLRLIVDDDTIEIPGPKQRAVLALLALAEGRTVTVDALRDALWPAASPGSGRRALHTSVSRLRGHLGPAAARLETRPDGYRFPLGRDELDLTRARALLTASRVADTADPSGALSALSEAHALWRGPVLADLDDVATVATAIESCARLRREVTVALIDAAIRAGRGEEVVGLAIDVVDDEPLREPGVLLLMRSLAASGRVTEALAAARDFRQRLADEAGLDPTPALDDLQRAVAAGAAGPMPARRGTPTLPTSRLIGRESDVAALHRLLASERLVTVVGPGGIGKTSLALELARRTETAIVLPLASIADPASVAPALAVALALDIAQGDVLSACVAYLGERGDVLVIDNGEHLLEAVRDVVQVLLPHCPGLRVLVTSREPLGLVAEYTFRLSPLAVPRAGQDARKVPSVEVFLERAERVRPGFVPTPDDLAVIGDIVRRLDGMPLAIELAAGRLSTYSVTDLLDRLDRSLDLLAAGHPGNDDRHRTLRATIAWSYDLLTLDERRLFRHLAVFVDGVGLDTAEGIAAALAPGTDPGIVLSRLVDASMLQADFDAGGTRYRMLETLRVFGLDRLAATGELDRAVTGMIRWAVDLVAWIEGTLATAREPEADAVLRREFPNLRAVWPSVRGGGSLDAAATIVVGLFDAIAYRDLTEIRGWAEELASDPGLATHPRATEVLGTAAEAAYQRGDHAEAERLALEGLARATAESETWYCHLTRSVVALARADFAAAVHHTALATAGGTRPREAHGIAALATAYGGDVEQARTINRQGVAVAISPSMRSWHAYVAGEIESSAGARDLAEQHYLEAIDLARVSGASFLVGVATVGLVAVRGRGPQVHDALHGYRETIDYFTRTGNWTHLWATLRDLADLLRRLGDPGPAALLDAAAAAAPDAPAVAGAAGTRSPEPDSSVAVWPSRAEALLVARRALDENLA
jgi:predicted ATPase/DNA-binding SARP family transcriptional activator